ncbi:MAG: hypothetical protein Edafosvirus3_80 [Edafosvirus sp.]|uniref:Uncharacterized protein n=1 Tax=Edafosvirus sp. TaxID=2487765 RepID=A0A3G4ZSW2_9VIRU|nr:MAG: hypothetical protein Edafosvirus3_80 [Edafosvirus sp.]
MRKREQRYNKYAGCEYKYDDDCADNGCECRYGSKYCSCENVEEKPIKKFPVNSGPDNISEAMVFHENRIIHLEFIKGKGFLLISIYNQYIESKLIIDKIEGLSITETDLPFVMPNEPDDIDNAILFHEKTITELKQIQEKGFSVISKYNDYITNKAIVDKIQKEISERKAREEAEIKRKKDLEEKKWMEEETRRHNEINEAKRVKKFLEDWRPYLIRCMEYMGDPVDMNHIAFTNEKEMLNYIVEAHEAHNDSLLEGRSFPGCSAHGISGGEYGCKWTYGDYRCSCSNYKGFKWNTDDINSINLNRFSIDSTEPTGYQERMW